jgi:hypothetical protein
MLLNTGETIAVLGLLARAMFRPFDASDHQTFSGTESPDPEIAEVENDGDPITIIVDGENVQMFIDGQDGMLYTFTLTAPMQAASDYRVGKRFFMWESEARDYAAHHAGAVIEMRDPVAESGWRAMQNQ